MQATLKTPTPTSTTAPVPTPPPAASADDAVAAIAARYATDAAPASELAEQAAPFADVDLSGAPQLRPVKKLRARQRVTLYKAMLGLNKRLEGRPAGADGQADLTVDDLDVIVEMDEFLEQMAVDPEQYAAWATEEGGPEPESRIAALFATYSEQLGESTPSTT